MAFKWVEHGLTFIKDVKAGSTLKYDPEKYDVSKPLVEKLLFSAPEYFVFETRFGGWLVSQLVKVLRLLDRFLMTEHSPSSRGYPTKMISNLSSCFSGLMSLINNHKVMS